MFWYKKSNTKHSKIKTQDIQIFINSICEEKVHLWTYDITFSGYFFMVRSMLIFSERVPSRTTFSFMTQICHWLCWLHCFARLHIKIHHSLVTTLTMLIYMKNSFITDYAYYADIHDNMKNSFITEFADYLVFNTRKELISSLTTLTTQILESICKIILL